MLVNILISSFLLFSLVNFLSGVKIATENPLYLAAGILSILLLYLLALLPRSSLGKIDILRDGLFWKIKTNDKLRVPIAIILLLLSFGNFVYAHWWTGAAVVRGAEYIEATVLSLLAFVLLKKK